MDAGKVVLGILAAVGIVALCATIFRSVYFAMITGNPMTFAAYTVAIFLLGVFLGSMMRRQ